MLVGGFVLAASRQPASYDANVDTISALAARGAPDRWIMTLAFVLLGLCHLVTSIGLRHTAQAAGGLTVGGRAVEHPPVEGLAARSVAPRGVLARGVAVGGLEVGGPAVGRLAVGGLAVGGLATAGLALAPLPTSGSSTLHQAIAGVALIALALWPLGTRSWAAAGVLLVLLGWFAVALASGHLVGLSERVVTVTEAAWPAVAVRLAATRQGPRA